MDGKLAAMIFTDPPYNVAYEGGTAEKLTIQNDSMPADQFNQFLLDAFRTMFAVTEPGGAIYVCHADSEGSNFRGSLQDAGWLLKQCLVWANCLPVVDSCKRYVNRYYNTEKCVLAN